MRRSAHPLLLLITLAFVLTPPALAATVYVDASALPGGDGLTPGTAFQTLQQGVDFAATGDTVLVAPGTYATTSLRTVGTLGVVPAVVFMKAGVAIAASDPDPTVTVIDGGGTARGVVFENAAGSVDGFTIRNGFAGD